MARPVVSAIQRFEAHVHRGEPHHRWTGSPDPHTGTGQFRLAGKLRSAQRAAWELYVGPIPAGVRVRSCPQEPMCVRLDHLCLEPSCRRIAPTAASCPDLSNHMSVSIAFPLYIAHLVQAGRAETTLAAYRSIYRRWLSRPLRDIPVNGLTDHAIESTVDGLRNAVPQSAAVATSILHGLSAWAKSQNL